MPRKPQLRRLNVVAGILRDEAGRILITERIEPGPFFGMWEFPGGKIGDGEQPGVALARELREEIGIEVMSACEFMHLEHRYPDRHVEIRFFLVDDWQKEPAGLEGQGLKWVSSAALATENLLPADQPVVDALIRRSLPPGNGP